MPDSGSDDRGAGVGVSRDGSRGPTPPRTWAEAWATYQPILDALARLHGRGLVHGNLSLASFEFTDSGTLTDGSLERLEAQSAAQSVPECGPYTAPEYSLGAPADEPRVDVYSLGIILYELLCGRLPWPNGLDADALQELKANSKLPNPKRFQNAIPLDVLKVLRAATAGSPQVRPQSASVMRALLGPAGHSVPDEPESSSLSLDAEPQLAQKASIAPPTAEADTNLNQLPTDLTPAGHRSDNKQALDDAPTAVVTATKRPATGGDPTGNLDATNSSIGDATTTVIQGALRPELAQSTLEDASTIADAPPSLQSGADLAAGAVTTLHPAALRRELTPPPESAPNSRGQLDDIRALLDGNIAAESTEVLAFSEDAGEDLPTPGSVNNPESALQPPSATPKGRRRKRRGARPKESRPSGKLVLGLTLALGILVLGGLSIGLMMVRSLAQGPDSTQTGDLLGLSDAGEQAAEPAEERDTTSDPYSDRWKDLEGEEPSPDTGSDGDADTTNEDQSSLATAGQPENEEGDPPAAARAKDQDRSDRARASTASSSASRPTPAADRARSAGSKPAAGGSVEENDASDTAPSPEAGLKLRPTASTTAAQVGRRTLFSVGIDDLPQERALTVKLHMRCVTDSGRWRLYNMKRSGRKTWDHRINFAIADRGRCNYYFTARAEGDATSASLGSKSKPFEVQVR